MPAPDFDNTAQYGVVTGLIYVFNVIVGTGALAIPGAVSHSGYLLSPLVLFALALTSFITVTLIIETMAIVNAMLLSEDSSANGLQESSSEDDPLINPSNPDDNIYCSASFDITKRVEMVEMCRILMSPLSTTLLYLTLVIYLYGDLSIYITVVAKSLRDLTCNANTTINGTTTTINCASPLSQMTPTSLYRLYTIVFILLIGPFVFTGISKTKYLQMMTTIFRWLAFATMLTLSISIINRDGAQNPIQFDLSKFSNIFGVGVYSFMCHHSLPGLVTPIANKRNIFSLFLVDYGLILAFYLLLALTGVFAFPHVLDLYTLNFISHGHSGFVNNLLALFPVVTLSTNFPIIAITLKNNLKTILKADFDILFTVLAIIPPLIVSIFVEDVGFLVGVTGSFSGAIIQYAVPVALVYQARSKMGENWKENPWKSYFQSGWWLVAIAIWCFVSMGIVSSSFIF